MRYLTMNLRLIGSLSLLGRARWVLLGFVDSALDRSQRSPETRPPGGSRGFLYFEPRVFATAARVGN